MSKKQANFRLDADIQKEAYAVLKRIGIKPTDAVNMFMAHIAMFKELPFRPSVPNAETLKAIEELENGGGTTRTLEEFRKSLEE